MDSPMEVNRNWEEKAQSAEAFPSALAALSDQEVLALIVDGGVGGEGALRIADRLLEQFQGLEGLSWVSCLSIEEAAGFSSKRALSLAAAFEMGRRVQRDQAILEDPNYRPRELWRKYLDAGEGEENFQILAFSVAGDPLLPWNAPKGRMGLPFSAKEVMEKLLKGRAGSFLLLHHVGARPPMPGREEIAASLCLEQESKEFGVRMLDHVILAREGYYSFRRGACTL